MGKIVRKDYLSTAVEIAKKGNREKGGKMFYRDDNIAPYSIVLSRL